MPLSEGAERSQDIQCRVAKRRSLMWMSRPERLHAKVAVCSRLSGAPSDSQPIERTSLMMSMPLVSMPNQSR